MAVRFVERHMEGGNFHQHNAALRWNEDSHDETKESTRQVLVDWVRKGGTGYVRDSLGNVAKVRVVEANPPYIQTFQDGVPTNNLLALPTY